MSKIQMPYLSYQPTPQLAAGFTLIELLIALTILGILMTMAIPVYFDHQTKAQLAESVTLGGAHRVNIEDYILNNNVFPPNEEANALVPWTEELDGELINRYPTVNTVELLPESARPTAGQVRITLAEENAVASSIRGAQVIFRRTESGSWYCYSDVETSIMPKGCRALED